MQNWAEDLMWAIHPSSGEAEAFARIASAAHVLGFEWCAFGLRVPLPVTNPRVALINNYPRTWQMRYEEAGYLRIDPTVLHGRTSQVPLVWSDGVFASAGGLWSEAQSAGLRYGWCQSNIDLYGVTSMLSLSRSSEPITVRELADKRMRMGWLVSVAHMALGRVVKPKLCGVRSVELTARETEVLKWTVDGKTAGEIADILSISIDTVNFHVKNATVKLSTPNKATAAVRALAMGLLA
ncbi:autoinducer binding domain-containing protein [Delftia sp. Cs1-4]|uniref:autoinducer binding domain-containing protein n=1 Tax=Delftia sp. (strain Cs1-4) TaxID=742013 RepID=UPI0005C254A1|nr:autoinducer binding domain-containing protein [Delftia sp. Cs1-4]